MKVRILFEDKISEYASAYSPLNLPSSVEQWFVSLVHLSSDPVKTAQSVTKFLRSSYHPGAVCQLVF